MLKKLVVPLLAGLLIGAGGFFGLLATGALPSLAPIQSKVETTNTEVIQSVKRTEQIVLLSLGIQGVSAIKGNATIWGMPIPGSERASFLQYNFNAKLGIEGKDVEFAPIGTKGVRVILPGFIFIGHSNETFQTVAETNGVLSFTTPEIDTAEVITNILNSEAQQEYIAKNQQVLQEQAKVFYVGIINGIDPSIAVEFKFSN